MNTVVCSYNVFKRSSRAGHVFFDCGLVVDPPQLLALVMYLGMTVL